MLGSNLESAPSRTDPTMHEAKIDIIFGGWIRLRREDCGYSLNRAALMAAIPMGRLWHLERGTGAHGATKRECRALAATYGIEPAQVMAMALGQGLL